MGHETKFDSLDTDRVNGAIHDIDHPAVTEGGLAVLRGNLAPDGAVVKTAGVPKEIWKFRGPRSSSNRRSRRSRSFSTTR